jgi:hypothetical protein
MNNPVELPSGKILNIARFIALIPNVNSGNTMSYDLLMSGYANPISLEVLDANVLKQILQLEKEKQTNNIDINSYQEEQLQKNQKAISILEKRIASHQKMSEEESIERVELFESFKDAIDAERLPGQKLYSEK